MDVLVDIFESFSSEQVKNIRLSALVGQENDDVLLIRSHKLILVPAENSQQLEHWAFFVVVHLDFLRGIHYLSQDLARIEV